MGGVRRGGVGGCVVVCCAVVWDGMESEGIGGGSWTEGFHVVDDKLLLCDLAVFCYRRIDGVEVCFGVFSILPIPYL